MDEKKGKSSISQSSSVEEMARFWDEHDTVEFEDQTHEVDMAFDLDVRRHYIAIDPDLLTNIRKTAASRGLSTESLVNLWLQERLLAQGAS
jgi:hypothetical protein